MQIHLGFFGILFIALLILKLTGVATISWIWVFCPLWIIPVIIALIVTAFIIIAIFVSIFSKTP